MYRSTPLKVGYSPSQLLMSRTLRSLVPTTRVQRKPHVPDITSVRREDRRNKARQKEDFDSHHGARPLPPLQPGDKVWVPGRESETEVKREVAPLSYKIETEEGTFRRNRQHLIHLPTQERPEKSGAVEDLTDPLASTAETGHNEQSISMELRRSMRHTRPPERLDPSC